MSPLERMSRGYHNGCATRQFLFCVYHAGLTLKKRRESFSEWKSGNVQIIVATVALGMGIDKKDVRFIWHLGTPSAIERAF